MPYLFMKACASASVSWTFTPTNVTWPAVRRAASCSTAASSAHGPHHEAQKFTTTGRPDWSVSDSVKVEPSNRPSEKLGALVNGTLTTFAPATSFCCSPHHSKTSRPTTTKPETAARAAGNQGRVAASLGGLKPPSWIAIAQSNQLRPIGRGSVALRNWSIRGAWDQEPRRRRRHG